MDKNKKGDCSICKLPYFERNNFFYGKLMTVRDFFAEQCYFNEKRWLINRTTIGSGVVCGLEVEEIKGDANKVRVLPGMAIDCCGREIVVCEPREIELEPVEDKCEQDEQEKKPGKQEYLICIEYRECKTEPLPLPPISCDQKEKCEFNRIRDSFEIKVIKQPTEIAKKAPFCPQDKNKKLHDYLCQRLLKECPDCPDCPESNCVILAEVTVTCEPVSEPDSYKGNGTQKGQKKRTPIECRIEIDNCQRRKLVISNDVLYDLIHCYHGDLPHIVKIGWKHGKPMSWTDFEIMLQHDQDKEESGEQESCGPVLKVTFDRNMKGVNKDTFLFLVKHIDLESGYQQRWYIPGQVEYHCHKKSALFIVEKTWFKDMMNYSFMHGGADFEVIIRGDHIVEDKGNGKIGKALDGNFIGGELPSGNGTQGGDFVSWFSVGKKPVQSNNQDY